ncbi:hypothetical protein EMWEY_00013140 [Eimeria maxima]|uniref:Uncharacterized protein n=1 Tax=Eimeria maxima TaxID=5804 RepID=U6M196_EIMMA|nr:hypothetical protein EMWEY_00013140 [Eimeria maxima]CDJ58002.1 hypothetical protein EMWEY_00013140 [Eimeria maxima]
MSNFDAESECSPGRELMRCCRYVKYSPTSKDLASMHYNVDFRVAGMSDRSPVRSPELLPVGFQQTTRELGMILQGIPSRKSVVGNALAARRDTNHVISGPSIDVEGYTSSIGCPHSDVLRPYAVGSRLRTALSGATRQQNPRAVRIGGIQRERKAYSG